MFSLVSGAERAAGFTSPALLARAAQDPATAGHPPEVHLTASMPAEALILTGERTLVD